MPLDPNREPKPVNYPQRPNIALHDPAPKMPVSQEGYKDPRRAGQIHVRFDYDAAGNALKDLPDYQVISPDDHNISIDSANDVPQAYYLPPSTTTGIQTLRPIVDTVNNLYISYHFDHRNNRWIKMVTRLRKDLHYPQPPVTYNANRVPYYGSRGSRYVRYKKKLVPNTSQNDQEVLNRIYFDRAGLSGMEAV